MRLVQHAPRQQPDRRRAMAQARAGGANRRRNLVSAFHGRREDDRLLKGQGRYTADWNLPGQLYGYFLRSDRAHARIVSLKFESSPGVRVFVGKDTADLKTPPPMVKFPGRGEALK